MTSFAADNGAYEAWLRSQCEVVEADLARKHDKMTESPLHFMRATYFRWARTIEDLLPALSRAPSCLAVGDIHLENFGAWRDGEGRLAWGVNDFDEAATMPFAFDLVRLAASVRLGLPELGLRASAEAILEGYRGGLKRPRPTILDRRRLWMRKLVTCSDDDRRKFWAEIDAYHDVSPPPDVERLLRSALPKGASVERFATHSKGGGSLGRPRFVAIARWRGGAVLREAKALVPSAWHWAHGVRDAEPGFLKLAQGPYRSPDPFLDVKGGYVVRRLAPDSRKLEFDENEHYHVDDRVLAAMGAELACLHAVTPAQARQITEDLCQRKSNWLTRAAKDAASAVLEDYETWIAHPER